MYKHIKCKYKTNLFIAGYIGASETRSRGGAHTSHSSSAVLVVSLIVLYSTLTCFPS